MSVEVECDKVAETDNALCVKIDGEKVWFPWSQVKSQHFNTQTNKGMVEVSDWIAEQRGLT